MNIPPPMSEAELFSNVQLFRVGLLRSPLYIPPPKVAELLLNVQSVRAELLSRL